MAEAALIDEIVKLVAEISGRSDVRPDSRLGADLGIDGDDAIEILGRIASKYEIDWSEFQFPRYFDDEGADFFQPFFVIVARRISRSFDARWRAVLAAEREITLRHLAHVAEMGRWIEPDEPRIAQVGPLRTAFAIALALPIIFIGFVAPAIMTFEIARRLAAGDSIRDIVLWPLTGFFGALVIWSSLTNIRRKLATAPR